MKKKDVAKLFLCTFATAFFAACGEETTTERIVEVSADDFSCATEQLKDKSGIKIVCNGDSIGVVLNGSDGRDGADGKNGTDGKDGVGVAGKDGKDGEKGDDGVGCTIAA
jgi:hypothetical protein